MPVDQEISTLEYFAGKTANACSPATSTVPMIPGSFAICDHHWAEELKLCKSEWKASRRRGVTNFAMRSILKGLSLVFLLSSCGSEPPAERASEIDDPILVSRSDYADRLEGFWLGQSIANWTGIITELDKIGGDGPTGDFYTREDWGSLDQSNIYVTGTIAPSTTIDWVFIDEDSVWGSDDDTDIEYIYQHLMITHQTSLLTGEQIRDGWLNHIYSDDDTPFRNTLGEPENYLWVSNQAAFDLMQDGVIPPATSDPDVNPYYEMIDAQLTTEIFGLYAPGRPDVALRLAHLPIRTTARDEAAQAAEFYVVMHSLAAVADPDLPMKQRIESLASEARARLPDSSYIASMYDFVESRYRAGVPWEQARDEVYQRYQIEQQDGYDIPTRHPECYGCFAAGINFAASIVSLLYGEGDYEETVKIAVLAGWDSDNPAATWGGLLGFMLGKDELERLFDRRFSDRFNIHRTRKGFPAPDGIDTFGNMAEGGIRIVDRVVVDEMGGTIADDGRSWRIPVLGK